MRRSNQTERISRKSNNNGAGEPTSKFASKSFKVIRNDKENQPGSSEQFETTPDLAAAKKSNFKKLKINPSLGPPLENLQAGATLKRSLDHGRRLSREKTVTSNRSHKELIANLLNYVKEAKDVRNKRSDK